MYLPTFTRVLLGGYVLTSCWCTGLKSRRGTSAGLDWVYRTSYAIAMGLSRQRTSCLFLGILYQCENIVLWQE
jgi:hypothetical protein